MKRIYLLLICFLFKNLSSIDQATYNSLDKDKHNFLLLVKDFSDQYYLSKLKLSNLIKTEFPSTGPLIQNSMKCEDFTKVDLGFMNQIKEFISSNKCFELPVFCIDSTNIVEDKDKVCGFEIPGKVKFGYVFSFKHALKETKGIIINDENLVELLKSANTEVVTQNEQAPQEEVDPFTQAINDATSSEELPEEFVVPPPASRVEVFLKEILSVILLKYADAVIKYREFKEALSQYYNSFFKTKSAE